MAGLCHGGKLPQGQWMQACASVSAGSSGTEVGNEGSRYLWWAGRASLGQGGTEKGRGEVGTKVLNLELKWHHKGLCQNTVGCSACWAPKYCH